MAYETLLVEQHGAVTLVRLNQAAGAECAECQGSGGADCGIRGL